MLMSRICLFVLALHPLLLLLLLLSFNIIVFAENNRSPLVHTADSDIEALAMIGGQQQLLFREHHKTGHVLAKSIYEHFKNERMVFSFGKEELLIGNFHIIHFVRHPLDVLLSGYLYHKKCSEPWTHLNDVDRAKNNKADFPLNFPLDIRMNYCKFLKSSAEEVGLTMELYRTLGAKNGLWRMLRDILLYQHTTYEVMNFCMSKSNETMPMLGKFIEPFLKLEQLPYNTSIPDVPGHHTNHKLQQQLMSAAMKVMYSIIPRSVIDSFPCPSVHQLDDSRGNQFKPEAINEAFKDYLRDDNIGQRFINSIQEEINNRKWGRVRLKGEGNPLLVDHLHLQ